ncbi:prolyl 4-hydroxylase subunit alpha-1-like [Glandiceps talaboti]
MFTSMKDFERLVSMEQRRVSILKTYIEMEENRMTELKRFLHDVLEFRRVNRLDNDAMSYLSNPAGAYKVIKRYKQAWNEAITENSYVPSYHRDFVEAISYDNIFNPKQEDTEGAVSAILRLQQIYNLQVDDIASGNIAGNLAISPLSFDDCTSLTHTAYTMGKFHQAAIWYEYIINKYATVGSSQFIELMESLVISHFNDGNWSAVLANINKILPYGKNWTNYTALTPGTDLYNGLHQMQDKVLHNVKEHKYKTQNVKAADDPNYQRLCRGEHDEGSVLGNAQLYCKYVGSTNPRLKLKPVKMEVVHLDPWIVIYHDVISDKEAECVKQLAIPKMVTSLTFAKDGNQVPTTNIRVSKTAWLKDEEHSTVAKVSKRIEDITGLSTLEPDHAEQLQVVNYGIGGQYDPHHDFRKEKEVEDKHTVNGSRNADRNRIATWMFYLSDVKAGGHTVFNRINVFVKPIKNAAAFWWNLLPSGQGDVRTLHAGCPVLLGSKWVANKWIHNIGQEFRRQCSLTPDN